MVKDESGFDSLDSDDSEDTATSEGYTQEDLENFARAVEALLANCSNGQSWEDGEPVWMNNHTELNYVMDDADVPEDCREEVAELVRCPCCSTSHELWEEVGRKSEGELHYESLMAEWYENHEHRLDAFYEFLTTYPYLGAAHDFGKEIRKVISEFPSTIVSNDLFYRARRIESGREHSLEDFVPPDPAKCFVGEGRYNHAGQSVMYLSADKIGAAVECIRDGENRAWIHGFRISQVEKILDLTADEDWADENIQEPYDALLIVLIVGNQSILSRVSLQIARAKRALTESSSRACAIGIQTLFFSTTIRRRSFQKDFPRSCKSIIGRVGRGSTRNSRVDLKFGQGFKSLSESI
jgi:hypothetical protein